VQLQDFITQSLVQIVQGVEAAADALKDSSAVISPVQREKAPMGGTQTLIQKVDFDVAVFVSEGTETKGGIGIAIASITLGSTGKSDTSSSSQSRLRFSVPIMLPDGHELRERS
jgi:hypothetical protein